MKPQLEQLETRDCPSSCLADLQALPVLALRTAAAETAALVLPQLQPVADQALSAFLANPFADTTIGHIVGLLAVDAVKTTLGPRG